MATFTRLQLRTRQNDTDDFSSGGARDFSLVNNNNTTAYFNIEGGVFAGSQVELFGSASITSPVSCSFLTSSTVAGFIINPNSTATFTLTPSSFIPKEAIDFFAANVFMAATGSEGGHAEVVNQISGSTFGVNLNTNV